ncbi:MAG: ComF family protein [Nitrospirae bacterium]|nr:ComF family protein [Candidatus Manganitrophaceae bacterium]
MFGIGDRFNTVVQRLLNLLYPHVCFHCTLPITGAATALPFCASCWGGVRLLSGPHCPVCAIPFPSGSALSHSPDHRCGECRDAPPPFTQAITPFAYEGALAEAIQRFKYRRQTTLALPLATLLLECLDPVSFDQIAAVPLHPSRLRAREFNQSLLIARQVALRLKKPLLIDLMERTRETPPQVGLSKKERDENVRRAFRIINPAPIQGKRVLLLDDVYTTGATLKEGAKTLLKSGAEAVVVAAVARML